VELLSLCVGSVWRGAATPDRATLGQAGRGDFPMDGARAHQRKRFEPLGKNGD